MDRPISMGTVSADSRHRTYAGHPDAAFVMREDARTFFYDMCLPSTVERIKQYYTELHGPFRALENPRNLHAFAERRNLELLRGLLRDIRGADAVEEEEDAIQRFAETRCAAMDRAMSVGLEATMAGMMEWALLDPEAHARLVFALYDGVLFGAAPHAYDEEEEDANPSLPPSLVRRGHGSFVEIYDLYAYVDVAYLRLERFLSEAWMPYVCQHHAVWAALAALLRERFDPARHCGLAHALGIFPERGGQWPEFWPAPRGGC